MLRLPIVKASWIAAALLAASLATTAPLRASVWPTVVERLCRSLASDDVAERRAAAGQLRELSAAVATPLVLQALDDSDAEVRLSAARAAVELRLAPAGARVVPWLAEADARLRLAACEVIELAPDQAAVAPLARVLGDANDAVRLAAANTLGAMGTAEAVPSLLGHLDDASPDVRAAIVSSLGRIADPRAVVPLLGKVQDGVPEVRRITVRVLGDLGDRRASSALLLALRDKSPAVRIDAMDSLGRLGATDATSAIAPLALDSSSPRVQAAAIDALGRIGTPVAIEALMSALDHDDPLAELSPVRAALMRVGDAAVPELVRALHSGSPTSRAAASLVLGSMRRVEHTRLIIEAMHRGQVPATVGLRALAAMNDVAALPSVLEMMASPSASVRLASMKTAAVLLQPSNRDGRAVDPIVAQLTDPARTDEERVALTTLLGRTGAQRAAPMLMTLAQSNDRNVQLAAIESLGHLGPAQQQQMLLKLLDDPDADVRLASAMALARLADGSLVSALVERLTQASEQDRLAVGLALTGASAGVRDDAAVQLIEQALVEARESMRDVLIEALGRAPVARAGKALAAVASTSSSADDRRKAIEALANHPDMVQQVRASLSDADPTVQAVSAWVLGQVGEESDASRLQALLAHRDVTVAGNAAAALGRLSARHRGSVGPLCQALDDARAYVRANALAGMQVAAQRCGEGQRERAMLMTDSSALVRARAARLIKAIAAQDAAADRRALRRCWLDDRYGEVARACDDDELQAHQQAGKTEPVTIFVVEDGQTVPRPRAQFALVLADGLMRLGAADRRGAVTEVRAPRGPVELAVVAELGR